MATWRDGGEDELAIGCGYGRSSLRVRDDGGDHALSRDKEEEVVVVGEDLGSVGDGGDRSHQDRVGEVS